MVSLERVLSSYNMIKWDCKGDLPKMYATVCSFLNHNTPLDSYEESEKYNRVKEILMHEICDEYMKQNGYIDKERCGIYEKEEDNSTHE